MMKITKRGWIEIAGCFGAFAVIATIAAFYDLEINKALYGPGCLYAQFFANLGEMPSYFAPPVIGSILFFQKFGKSQKLDIAAKVVGAGTVYVGYTLAIGLWFIDNMFREDLKFKWVYAVFFAAIMTVLTLVAFSKIPDRVMKKLFWFAVFLLIVAILSNVIVQIMKVIFARQRFRTMTPGNPSCPEALTAIYPGYNYDGFTPWYIPASIIKQPIRTEEYVKLFKDVDGGAFMSFPSGHTAAASASFGLVILPDLFPEFRKRRWMFWVFPAIYAGLVGISRIVAAAHYLSDTLFGFYSGLTVAALARWILVSKVKAYKPEENTEYLISPPQGIVVLDDRPIAEEAESAAE